MLRVGKRLDILTVAYVFYSAFIQQCDHGRPSHGSVMAESFSLVQTLPRQLSLDNCLDYNLAEETGGDVILSS